MFRHMLSLSRCALVGGLLAAGTASATIPAGAVVDPVFANRSSPAYDYDLGGNTVHVPGFAWTASYDRYFDGQSIVKHLEIDFLFLGPLQFSDAQKAAWRAEAEQQIEAIWNDKYYVRDAVNDRTYALKLDITTEGPFHKIVEVALQPGDCASRPNDLDCREDLDTWFQDSPGTVKAHEVGHMLGLYDEYLGGAIDDALNPTLSDDGLMGLGAVSPDPVMYERYYRQYLDFLETIPLDQYPGGSGQGLSAPELVLVAVPEPGTWALLLAGGGLLALGARRAHRR